jgi:UDP-N-acetylglucosamine 4,6-dehydratase
VTHVLAGKSVLVTGGTGSFANAFCRAALAADARRVIVYSRGEAKQAAMKVALPDERMRYLIGDVRDSHRIADACRGVDIVVHAAALKRVEVCEADPLEAIATNITGTACVARACIERGVERAILLSTDKAAAPETLYGSTKLTAERLWTQSNVYAAGTPTRFAATRYGNVASSTGSVIPLWKAQRVSGEVTVTEPFGSIGGV